MSIHNWTPRPPKSAILPDEIALMESLFLQVEAGELTKPFIAKLTGRPTNIVHTQMAKWQKKRNREGLTRVPLLDSERVHINTLLQGTQLHSTAVRNISGRSISTLHRIKHDANIIDNHHKAPCAGKLCPICTTAALAIEKNITPTTKRKLAPATIPSPAPAPAPAPATIPSPAPATIPSPAPATIPSSVSQFEQFIDQRYGDLIDTALINVIERRMQHIMK